MSGQLRVVLAQLNFTVGDIANNQRRIVDAIVHARDVARADLIVFPELAICGYPAEDLLLRDDFIAACAESLAAISAHCHGISVIVSYPQRQRRLLYNAAVLLQDGAVQQSYHKQCLPNYGVFDEQRYFAAGQTACVFNINGIAIGLLICEDLWHPQPIAATVAAGATLIISLHASPFDQAKPALRLHTIQQRARAHHVPIVYVHHVGGQDELVFDGGSMVIDKRGTLRHLSPHFSSHLATVDIDMAHDTIAGSVAPTPSDNALLYNALCCGTHDYVQKNGFHNVLLGLSGGLDSALTLAVAVDALGAAQVEAIMLPSRYTSAVSLEDAATLAATLGVKYRVLSIEPIFHVLLQSLDASLQQPLHSITTQNLQARCRMLLLMALSNQTGSLLLNTSNKSEVAVGYSTLYGDMSGAFAVLKDVYKTQVIALAHYRNGTSNVIPERTLTRPPSAELAEAQLDTDNLPTYAELDAILERYIEHDQSVDTIVAAGFAAHSVAQVIALVQRSEYKRHQAPPGVRVSRRAFGKDRRYPITSGFVHNSPKRVDGG